MTMFDLPLDQLRLYQAPANEPDDFDVFWSQTLSEARVHPLAAQFMPVDMGLHLVDSYDVTFNGFNGEPIKGWFTVPKQTREPLPCMVEYVGYGGGRGFPLDHLTWANLGYAHLVMDTRGQGSSWRKGDTPDPHGANPHHPGFMTNGVLDPLTYYYRRVFTDAVRAVEAARSHPLVDDRRIGVVGGSQGGGITIAVAGLDSQIVCAMPDVPFLCDMQSAVQITDSDPYGEVARYCRVHRDQSDVVIATLGYFDGVNFARRARAAALFSVALMDDICPPRTVFAAFNSYAGEKSIRIYPYNRHEGGQTYQLREQIVFARQYLA